MIVIACTPLRMTPARAIAAGDQCGVCLVRREKDNWLLEVGKLADIIVFEVRGLS